MLYGKMKNSDDYGFRFEGEEEMFESYVCIDDDIKQFRKMPSL